MKAGYIPLILALLKGTNWLFNRKNTKTYVFASEELGFIVKQNQTTIPGNISFNDYREGISDPCLA